MGLKPATNPDVEAATIELAIDGKTVTAKDGVSLYDVISSTGKIIPAMCYHYTFDPFGSCGMCLVMQEGKKAPVRSCTAKATAGMIIRTEGDDLFQARKKAVEKHLSVHPLDCPVCDADGHCELQDMAFQHGVTNLANAKQKFIPEDTRSPGAGLQHEPLHCVRRMHQRLQGCADDRRPAIHEKGRLQSSGGQRRPPAGLRVLRRLPCGLSGRRHHQ